MNKIVKYVSKLGKCPFDDFILELRQTNKDTELAQISLYIKLLEEYGHKLPGQSSSYAKHLDGKLYELRPGKNRIIYFFYNGNQEYVLLHGFHKKQQKTPSLEIEQAKKEMAEYERMNNNEKK